MIEVRKGLKEDCSKVYDLILELANFVNCGDQVQISLDDFIRDGFEATPKFEFFVALNAEELVGLALYYPKYSTWKGMSYYLEDLVVKEKYRGGGVGAKLFKALIDECKERGAARLDWLVLDWNNAALSFYKKLGADLNFEWVVGKLEFK